MKQIVQGYKIMIFGEENPFAYLTQEQGEKLIMFLSQPNPPKFVWINDEMLNTSSISRIEKNYNDDQRRELSASEEATHKRFEEMKNNDKLILIENE
jgi:hypothetical protein